MKITIRTTVEQKETEWSQNGLQEMSGEIRLHSEIQNLNVWRMQEDIANATSHTTTPGVITPGESEKDMFYYDCRKIGDFNCCLQLTRETDDFEIGDIYVDEYRDEKHHFEYGKYRVFQKWSDAGPAAG